MKNHTVAWCYLRRKKFRKLYSCVSTPTRNRWRPMLRWIILLAGPWEGTSVNNQRSSWWFVTHAPAASIDGLHFHLFHFIYTVCLFLVRRMHYIRVTLFLASGLRVLRFIKVGKWMTSFWATEHLNHQIRRCYGKQTLGGFLCCLMNENRKLRCPLSKVEC